MHSSSFFCTSFVKPKNPYFLLYTISSYCGKYRLIYFYTPTVFTQLCSAIEILCIKMDLFSYQSVDLANCPIAYFENILVWIQQRTESWINHFSHFCYTLDCIVIPHKIMKNYFCDFHDCDMPCSKNCSTTNLLSRPTNWAWTLKNVSVSCASRTFLKLHTLSTKFTDCSFWEKSLF